MPVQRMNEYAPGFHDREWSLSQNTAIGNDCASEHNNYPISDHVAIGISVSFLDTVFVNELQRFDQTDKKFYPQYITFSCPG